MKKWSLTLAASMSVLTLASCATPGGEGGGPTADGDNAIANSRLKTVLDRGELICGVEGNIPGFRRRCV